MNTIIPPLEVLEKANDVIKEFKADNWPEDDWKSIDANWDLNLWSDEFDDERECFATLYAVNNGEVDSTAFYNVFIE